MNFSKIDSALAMALDEESVLSDEVYSVFIDLASSLDSGQREFLSKLRVEVSDLKSLTFTATLSQEQIGQLSEQPWVKFIHFSQKVRPVNRKQKSS